ncbi:MULTISPECIES: sensor histidine kinase [Aerococcus]|uniref:sensor histidine kinase n=1 Tax=Aerococcus urinae (strain CCUG 59500 / ACS-120-V-Col10a) TaxID=2976812 RepID=UPI000200E5C9|nr:ATP-binding protein [Aerococcus sp. Group 1]AEA00373.1 ATPase/histidine kinase/DNA gyrase B/HSP90 domain protein [Aerococcus sp. Group 1]MCY3030383.1 ATP-binding protein [Aerococcus sp. Group 1]MCY3054865.1 ATP-binding protein [Aerococcus sp. Group 1]MCY3056595.1 ATP-binding protein [Aerococcus sp. Group 1]MCY3061823.1 ATP-binding protein [Aerococcus sp. Group 1]
MKDFLKHQRLTLVTMAFTLVVFFLLGFLFDLDVMVVRFLLLFLVFFYGLILLIAYWLARREVDYQKLYRESQDKAEADRVQTDLAKQEQEGYFLTWLHQIKTPIAAAKLLIQDLDAKTKADLEGQLLAIENYTTMALTYLKVNNEQKNLQIKAVSLDAMIAPLLKKYRRIFINSRTRLHYQAIPDHVMTDPTLSEIMIEQVLNNALKYGEGGDIWITYQADQACLTIKDNGRGIKASDLPKVFDQGYSAFMGKSLRRSTGIGLFLVKQLAERLDQPVELDSIWGQGTTVRIYFHQDAFR